VTNEGDNFHFGHLLRVLRPSSLDTVLPDADGIGLAQSVWLPGAVRMIESAHEYEAAPRVTLPLKYGIHEQPVVYNGNPEMKRQFSRR